MNHCYHKQMLGTVVVRSSFISVTQVRSLFAAYFFSSELLHSRLIFFSELIHLYKTFNTSWNNKKWCSAVERWVPHILRTRDRIPLFLCFLFIPGACYATTLQRKYCSIHNHKQSSGVVVSIFTAWPQVAGSTPRPCAQGGFFLFY